MTTAWALPRSAISRNFDGLLNRLAGRHDIADLDESGFNSLLEAPGSAMVLFTEEPDKVAESWDMAVIYPELLATIGPGPSASFLRPETARALQARFGIKRMPALLFLRDGDYVGAIEGLRDWQDFVAESVEMLRKPTGHAPTIGVAVVAAPDSH